jgi:hypothetical protein
VVSYTFLGFLPFVGWKLSAIVGDVEGGTVTVDFDRSEIKGSDRETPLPARIISMIISRTVAQSSF